MEKLKKHILLCVLGISPQIITETIYALSKRNIQIDELYIITTENGKKILEDTLIKNKILSELINDLKIKPFKFNKNHILVITNFKNIQIKDIRTILDNEYAGEFIFKIVRELTNHKDTVLHCSIAGGRKTMGFYLGSALQLFGRKDDKLYHVLVNEEFESHPEFFYPSTVPKLITIKTRDGKKFMKSTEEAKVELAELPFVRLSDLIDLSGKSFRQLIECFHSNIENLKDMRELIFMDDEKTIKIGEVKISLGFSLYELYLIFASQKKINCKHEERLLCGDCKDCFLPMKGDNSLVEITKKLHSDIRSKISKIRKIIWNELKSFNYGKIISFYEVSSFGSHGNKKYGLMIDKNKIIFKN